MGSSNKKNFREIVSAACDAKSLTQHKLAFHANVSQTAVSLVGSHQRSLSAGLAKEFAKVLGGTADFWLNTYDDYASGNAKPVEAYLAEISGGIVRGQSYGVGAKRLLNMDILRLFWLERDQAECRIKGFDPRRIGSSSYYTRLGYVNDGLRDFSAPVRRSFTFQPHEQLHVRTLEDFYFPMWLEAEFQAASSLSDLGLSVQNGPTIDPGYSGQLQVRITNQTNEPVTFETSMNFLKLRFTVFDSPASDEMEVMSKVSIQINEDIIFEDAINEDFVP